MNSVAAVAVGGGSPMDCAKCVALLKAEAQSAAAEETSLERPRPRHEVRAHSQPKENKGLGHSAEYWRSRAHR